MTPFFFDCNMILKWRLENKHTVDGCEFLHQLIVIDGASHYLYLFIGFQHVSTILLVVYPISSSIHSILHQTCHPRGNPTPMSRHGYSPPSLVAPRSSFAKFQSQTLICAPRIHVKKWCIPRRDVIRREVCRVGFDQRNPKPETDSEDLTSQGLIETRNPKPTLKTYLTQDRSKPETRNRL